MNNGRSIAGARCSAGSSASCRVGNGRVGSPTRFCLFSRGGEAFSLVEVVLAIGITAVALVGIFALLQSALGNYRDAMNATIANSIGQQVLSQYLLADFSKISGLTDQTGYYDERGLPLPDSDAATAVYVSVSRIIPNPVTNVETRNLVTVNISITSPAQRDFRKKFTSMIARQGKDLP